MKTTKTAQNKGFTLIELLVVITIIALLASFTGPAVTGALERGKIIKDVNNQRQIVIACRTFAADWDGAFPWGGADETGDDVGESEASSSYECFNDLIPNYIDSESTFWIKTSNPERRQQPKEDKNLESQECSFAYCAGLNDTSFSNSPLTVDGEMSGPGIMGEYHPWFRSKKAVVGFVGGHCKSMALTEGVEGATILSDDRRIEDIFQEYDAGEDSESKGLLATSPDNVLLPD